MMKVTIEHLVFKYFKAYRFAEKQIKSRFSYRLEANYNIADVFLLSS